MIIVSQDKSVIVNFNNVDSIEIGNMADNQAKGVIYARLKNDYFYKLGLYATEERAKEVLKEIADRYEILELARYSSRYELVYGVHTYSYEMPLE